MKTIIPLTGVELEELTKRLNAEHPKSNENNAYGALSELYDNMKDMDYSLQSDEYKTRISKQISYCTDDIIDYSRITPMKKEKFRTIIYRIKSIYATVLGIDIFTDFEKNETENLIAFDFELEPKTEPNPLLIISNADDKILEAIEEVKKTSKKRDSEKTITKDFKEYIIKEWTTESKQSFVDKIEKEFVDVKKEFESEKKLGKQPLNLLALALFDLKILHQRIDKKELFETTANLFAIKNPKKSQENFNKLERLKNYSNLDVYKTTVTKIEKIVREINIYNPNFKGL